MDYTEVVLMVAGGLALFIFSVINLGDTIQGIAGHRTKGWIERFTRNNLTAVLTGTVVTVLLDSSSAVIIITIVLINSRVLTFGRAIGVVMGANIGTTFSSQIIAMDVGKYSPVLLVSGLLMMVASRSDSISKTGRVFLYFGMLFFGLYTMERAVEPLKESNTFMVWMHQLENPVRGVLTGGLVTLIIQSSSATVGMAITLAKKELITLAAGVAVMLGAELGTCSDTLIASFSGSRQALKTGLFHLLFNLVSILIGMVLFTPFIQFVEWISGTAPIERKIANAHMLFNVGGVVLFFFLIPYIEKALNNLLPDKEFSATQ